MKRTLSISVVFLSTIFCLTAAQCQKCVDPGPDATPEQVLAYVQCQASHDESVENIAASIETSGGAFNWLTMGLSGLGAALVAELLRRFGKYQGAGAVARGIDRARNHALETSNPGFVIFDKAKASKAHDDAGVGKAIRSATN